MKKKNKNHFFSAGGSCGIGRNLSGGEPSSFQCQVWKAVLRMEEIIASSGCMACHTANPELPFYASLPVAGKLVKEDARLAYRSFDMTPMLEALKKGRESQRGRFGKSREGDIRRHHAYGQILSGALGGFVE